MQIFVTTFPFHILLRILILQLSLSLLLWCWFTILTLEWHLSMSVSDVLTWFGRLSPLFERHFCPLRAKVPLLFDNPISLQSCHLTLFDHHQALDLQVTRHHVDESLVCFGFLTKAVNIKCNTFMKISMNSTYSSIFVHHSINIISNLNMFALHAEQLINVVIRIGPVIFCLMFTTSICNLRCLFVGLSWWNKYNRTTGTTANQY